MSTKSLSPIKFHHFLALKNILEVSCSHPIARRDSHMFHFAMRDGCQIIYTLEPRTLAPFFHYSFTYMTFHMLFLISTCLFYT